MFNVHLPHFISLLQIVVYLNWFLNPLVLVGIWQLFNYYIRDQSVNQSIFILAGFNGQGIVKLANGACEISYKLIIDRVNKSK